MGELSFPLFLAIMGIVWVAVSIINIFKRWRKGFWKLGFKETFSGLVCFGGFVWALYFFMSSVMFIAPLAKWLETYVVGRELSDNILWVIGTMLTFYVVTIILIGSFVVFKAASYNPKYTEEEKALLRVEKLKWNKRLGWLRFVRMRD